jgi:hypothetical protein
LLGEGEEPFDAWCATAPSATPPARAPSSRARHTVDEVIDEVAATRLTERGATRADDRAARPPWKTASVRATSDERDLTHRPNCDETATDDRTHRSAGDAASRRRDDDGKSTLIGRLLYDSKSIFEDQLEAVEAVQRADGCEYTNLALLTDGLRAEREQGITIDVAYRYFATPRRKFIIADTPGAHRSTRATWSPARPPPTWRSCS